LLIEPVDVTFLYKLVCTYYQIDFIQQIEMIYYFVAKDPSCSSGIPSPSLDVFRIRPHEIGQRALMRNLLLPI